MSFSGFDLPRVVSEVHCKSGLDYRTFSQVGQSLPTGDVVIYRSLIGPWPEQADTFNNCPCCFVHQGEVGGSLGERHGNHRQRPGNQPISREQTSPDV